MNTKRTAALIGVAAGGAVLLWLTVAFFLPVVLPFLIGLGVAKLAEPFVQRLHAALHLPRWAATGLSVSALFALLGCALWLLLRVVCSELGSLVQTLPGLLRSLSAPLSQLHQWLLSLADRAPDGLRQSLRGWVSSLFESGSVLAEKLYETLFSFVTGMVSGLPDAALFFLTAVLSSFMISARMPQLRAALRRHLPVSWQQHADGFFKQLRKILGGWFVAQLKLMGVTFGVVTAGLFVIGIDFPLLFGGLIALIDALPVFGTGTVLIPWGVILFAQGQVTQGVGMILLYGIAALTRTALEPRLLGRQLGLHPLITLLALYAGFRLCGIGGMILFPVGAILLKQFYDLISSAHRQAQVRQSRNG